MESIWGKNILNSNKNKKISIKTYEGQWSNPKAKMDPGHASAEKSYKGKITSINHAFSGIPTLDAHTQKIIV